MVSKFLKNRKFFMLFDRILTTPYTNRIEFNTSRSLSNQQNKITIIKLVNS